MNRLGTIAVAALGQVLFANAVMADIDPANMRSGNVFINVESATQVHVNLFSVPAGMRFVLTDVAVTFGPINGVFLTVSDQTGAERWANWTATNGGRLDHHWKTGIVYEPGSLVDMLVSANASSLRTDLSWSGYLAPFSTTSATERDPQQIGLDVTPNPTRRGVTLRFELARADEVALGIYDVQGRKVRTIERGLRSEGPHEARWDGLDQRGRPMGAGTYFARFETKHNRVVKQFVALQ
jgi:hypothetical protein